MVFESFRKKFIERNFMKILKNEINTTDGIDCLRVSKSSGRTLIELECGRRLILKAVKRFKKKYPDYVDTLLEIIEKDFKEVGAEDEFEGWKKEVIK